MAAFLFSIVAPIKTTISCSPAVKKNSESILCVLKCIAVFHHSCAEIIHGKILLQGHKIICRDCAFEPDHDKDSDSDTFLKNCIEELKHEIIQKNNTIENMKIEHKKFYEAAIEMERDSTNKILQQKQTTEILESKIKTLTNSKVADKTEELVFASTQTDKIMEQQQQKQIEIKMTRVLTN
ncbi:hypothetical protein JTB14_003504 [Gonioctena quinquepunctata]|nr:hypothetical protein JTB14_003504 [Gonioctena quinquepunctata]